MDRYISILKNSFLKLNILIIDDNTIYLENLQEILEKEAKQKVFTAETGKKGFEIIKRQELLKDRIDIAMVDFILPGEEDGIEICKQIYNNYPYIDLLIISTKNDMTTKLEISNHPFIITLVPKKINTNLTEVLVTLLSNKEYKNSQGSLINYIPN